MIRAVTKLYLYNVQKLKSSILLNNMTSQKFLVHLIAIKCFEMPYNQDNDNQNGILFK